MDRCGAVVSEGRGVADGDAEVRVRARVRAGASVTLEGGGIGNGGVEALTRAAVGGAVGKSLSLTNALLRCAMFLCRAESNSSQRNTQPLDLC